ncbi:MAG TPA: sigma-54-dependent Fis family transcriptional regulator [Azospira sp.]|nr:sigma-54-dependent Fis family transcriptional regulator [Azospira sp.]
MNPATPGRMEPKPSTADAADPIERSWRRCADLGLTPDAHLPLGNTPRCTLADRLEANARLVAFAQPVIENLHQQIARSSSMVLLADDAGMVLRSVGDPDFVDRATQVALSPGAVWSEEHMGTNAIGTAIQERRTVAVYGDQHYLRRNQFLTCISTPIRAPCGGLVGILDISSDARVTHSHAQALLQTTAEIIENRLIETLPQGTLLMRFHSHLEALGTPLEGIAVFGEDGTLLASNRRAQQMLQRTEHASPTYRACFATAWNALLDHGRRRGDQPLSLRTAHGATVVATLTLRQPLRHPLHTGPEPTVAPPPPPKAPEAAPASGTGPELEDLDLGDKAMHDAIRRARRITAHDIPLLIQGETGTGKEVFAQAFHRSGPRRAAPFVAVNCAAIPVTLIEAELFGYVDGAYTGARRQGAPGKLREAHGGTLFLDEIGDMPLALQAVLLRVLETRRVTPLGGGPEEAVDIALVCASHRSLKDLTSHGLFRSDLFFRLSGMTLSLPPLRERSDFDRLVARLLTEEAPGRRLELAPDALRALRRHPWPGNLRQLRNALRLAVALVGEEERLELEHLPADLLEDEASPIPEGSAGNSLRATEIRLVHEAVGRHGGNISAAARELGITRTTLYRKLRGAPPSGS